MCPKQLIKENVFLLPLVGFIVVVFIDILGPWLFVGSSSSLAHEKQEALVYNMKWGDPLTDSRVALRDRSGRCVMEMANLLLVVTTIYVMVKCLIDIGSFWSSISWRGLGSVLGLGAVTLTLCFRFIDSDLNLFWLNSIPQRLFVHACTLTGSKRLIHFSFATQVMMQIALVIIAIQVCMMLIQDKTKPDDPADLAILSQQLQSLLYHAAAIMVLYSIEAGSEIMWPASFLPFGDGKEPKEGDLVQQLALGMSLTVGIYNTILLAFVFCPAIWLVTGRIQKAVNQISDLAKRQEAIEKNGFALTPGKYFAYLFSVLSPLLAGLPITKTLAFIVQ
jgi:hypothetical protein